MAAALQAGGSIGGVGFHGAIKRIRSLSPTEARVCHLVTFTVPRLFRCELLVEYHNFGHWSSIRITELRPGGQMTILR